MNSIYNTTDSVWPQSIFNLTSTISHDVKVDPAMALGPLLGCISALVRGNIGVEIGIKPGYGFRSTLSTFTMTVAKSGTGKGGAFRRVMEPLKRKSTLLR